MVRTASLAGRRRRVLGDRAGLALGAAMCVVACSSGSGNGSSSSSSTSSGSSSGSSSGATTSGSGSGSSSSGSSSSGGSGSSSSSGGSSGASSSGGGNGDTMLASGLPTVSALTVVGSKLFWVEPKSATGASGGTIESLPTTGGTPDVVLTDTLVGTLGTDGTALYFVKANASGFELDSIAPDGTGQKMLASGIGTTMVERGTHLFVVQGNVYLATTPQGSPFATVVSVPTTGGTPTVLAANDSGALGSALEVLWADASGVYFTMDMLTGGGVVLEYAPLSLASSTALSTPAGQPPGAGQLWVDGGAAYLFTESTSPLATTLSKVPVPSGAAATLDTYSTGYEGFGLVGDASGLYAFVGGSHGGIFSVDPSSGAQAPVDTSFAAADTTVDGTIHALDSAHLYFTSTQAGQYTLWARAR